MSKLEPHEIEERAAEARSILASKVFNQALDNLQQEYLNRLIQAEVGSLTAGTAHATLRVMNDIRNQLQTFINEATMQRNKK